MKKSITVTDTNRIPDLIHILDELNRREIRIGIFGKHDSFLLMIANVNEFGTTITPRRAKRLAIPLNKKARERSPRSFTDLFPLKANSGELFLVRNKGATGLEFMYWLATSVTIPERSFIRGGYDTNQAKIADKANRLLKQVILGQLDLDSFYTFMGEYIVSELRNYMTNLTGPPNSFATKGSKRGSNPLIDTGRLRDAITWLVVKS